MLEDRFQDDLCDDFDEMPRNRKSAQKILDGMEQWKIWELDRVSLQDFWALLTAEERERVVQNYKKTFDVSFASFLDEDILKEVASYRSSGD